MEFTAEIIRTAQRKLVSGDNQYELVIRTENPQILDLGKLKPDSVFLFTVNLHGSTVDKQQEEQEGYQQI